MIKRGPRSVASDWSIALLLVVPVVIIPGGSNRFVFGKLLVAVIGAGIAVAAPAVGRLSRTAIALLGAGAATVVAASMLSVSPAVSLLGRAPRFEGLPVLAVYVLAGLAGVRLLGPGRSERAVSVAVAAMAWSAVAIALLAALESLGVHPLSSDLARPGSLLGNASDQGAIGVLYAGPLIAAALERRTPLPVAGAVAAVAAVVLSASRGALVGLLVMFLVIAVLAGRRWWRHIVAVGVCAVIAALAIPFTRDRILGLSPLSRRTATGRELLWRETLSLLGQHPILGVGPSQFENAIVAEHDLAWQRTVGPANPPGGPHNVLLQITSAGGVVLLVISLAVVALLCQSAVQQWRNAPNTTFLSGCVAGLAGYAVALQFHLTSPGTTIPACILAGGLLAVPTKTPHRDRTGPSRKAGRTRAAAPIRWGGTVWWYVVAVVTVVLALMFLFASVAEMYLASARQAVAAGDFARADSDFAVAHRLRPWDLDLPGQAMTAFVTAASSGRAESTGALDFAAQWATRLGPLAGDEQLVQNQAALLLQAGDLDGAARLLDAQLAIDPHQPDLLVLRGVVHTQAGEYGPAIRDFRSAIAVDATDPQPWQDLAYVYTQQGRQDLADRAQATATKLAVPGG